MAKGKSKKRRQTLTVAERIFLVILTCVVIGIFVMVFLTWLLSNYHYADVFLFPLWYAALGLGVLSGVLFTLIFGSGLESAGKKIGVALMVTFLVFWSVGVSCAHLNHILDFHEPVEYTAVIEDKHYHKSRRTPTRYNFTLTVQGDTFTITVPKSDYDSLEEGDLYVVAYHKGAFNEPYYIAVGGVEE